MVFGMTGSFAVELAEIADIVERDGSLSEPFVVGIDGLRSSEMKRRPEQHGGMTVRQHETISIGPDRILRVETKSAVPDRINKRRKRHRGSGMAGFSLLDCVD